MIRKLNAAFVGIVAATQAAVGYTADQPLLVLEPASQWTLDFADERCTLSRAFGEGENAVRLQIASYGNPSYQMLVSGRPVPSSNKPSGEIRYAFSADKIERDPTTALMGKSDDASAVSFGFAFLPPLKASAKAPHASPDPDGQVDEVQARDQLNARASQFAAETDAVTLRFKNGTQVELKLGNMGQPMEGMRLCMEDLIKSWGFDPAELHTLKRGPVPLPTTVQKIERRYPSSMLMDGISAFVPIRVMVDETGKATGCVVQLSNVDKAFAETVCNGLARHFEPALDKDGKPIASIYQTAVIFLIG